LKKQVECKETEIKEIEVPNITTEKTLTTEYVIDLS
jgi:hypothetical protein